jgi:putative transposase
MAYISSADGWRRPLPHGRPAWLQSESVRMLTVCARPRRSNHLCRLEVAEDLRACLCQHHDRAEWQLIACVLMPDHFHVLALVPPDANLVKMVTDWKRLIARRHHVVWQRDFFEARLRSREHVDAKREYLRQNPVRAGLVVMPDEWPYFWVW